MSSTPNTPDWRSLLMRALAYLPVPATYTGRGTPVGVVTPDPGEITSVERLRREIQVALKTPQSERTPLSEKARAERMPPPPESLVGALQDRIETAPERTRPAHAARQVDTIPVPRRLLVEIMEHPSRMQEHMGMAYDGGNALDMVLRDLLTVKS